MIYHSFIFKLSFLKKEFTKCLILRVKIQMFCFDSTDMISTHREELFKQMADLMASEGYLAAGYDFISLDDCWMSHERTADGKLQSDPVRFPSGVKALADYVTDHYYIQIFTHNKMSLRIFYYL